MTAQGQPKPEGSLSNLDKLCTVNQISERAKLIVGRLVDDLKETYTIDHVANSPSKSFFFFGSDSVQDVTLRRAFTLR